MSRQPCEGYGRGLRWSKRTRCRRSIRSTRSRRVAAGVGEEAEKGNEYSRRRVDRE